MFYPYLRLLLVMNLAHVSHVTNFLHVSIASYEQMKLCNFKS